MATNKTFVPAEILEAVLAKALKSNPTLSIENKARWVKIQGPGGKLYMPKSKQIGTIHISGFVVEASYGVRDFDIDERPTGLVKQELDFRSPATVESLTEAFDNLLTLLSLTVKPVKAAKPAAPSAPEAPMPADSEEQVAAESA